MYICKIGGAQCHRPRTIDDIARILRDRPDDQPWALVHGAGPQLDIALESLGGPVRKVNGLRVTSPEAAQTVQKQMDFVGAELTHELRMRGVRARHVPASEHRLHAVRKKADGDIDLGRVGTATHFDTDGLDINEVLVISPVGWDGTGPLNVNADEGALAVATAFDAKRLVLLTDVEGVRSAEGRPIARLDPVAARILIADGTAAGGMAPKLRNGLAALDAGVPEVLIGDHTTLMGAGTRLVLPGAA